MTKASPNGSFRALRGELLLRRAATALVVAAGALGGIGGVGGCTNPLFSSDRDYPPRAAEERLRVIRRFEPERYADTAEIPTRPAEVGEPIPPPRSRFAGMSRVPLTIEEARAAALENNLDLRVVVVNPLLASEGLRQEEAKFEAVFIPRVNYAENDNPVFDVTASNQSDVLSAGAGVEIPLRTGGRATVDFIGSRTETANEFFALNTAYDTDLIFSISHPLLRSAGRRTNTASIRIAALEQDIAEATTKLEVIRQLAAVDRAYWRLYAARRALEVAQQQYELAAEQLARAERRVRAGDQPEVEIVRAQSGVAERLEAIIIAENEVLRQQRELKRIINAPDLDIGDPALVEPATPPDPVPYQFDAAALAQIALGPGGRMEMLELELRLAQDAINIEFNRNQALPLLTLDYQYRVSGLDDRLRGSLSSLARNKFESWSLGLSGEIPIGNEAARSRVQEAILTRLQRLATKDARAQAIRQEVYDAVDEVTAGWQRILAARQAVVAATRTFHAEQRQNEVGTRTSTDVLEAAAALAEAQLSEIRAVTDYQIALVDLAFATGTLLGAAKVDWTEATPIPAPEPRRQGPPEIEPSAPTNGNQRVE